MTNILLLTNLADVGAEPAFFTAFDMVHRIGDLCRRTGAEPPITFNIMESQKERFGTRLKNATQGLLYEWNVLPSKGKLALDIVVSILEAQDPSDEDKDPLAEQIERLTSAFEEKGIVNVKAVVPNLQKNAERNNEDPIKQVRRWKPEVPDNSSPYGNDFDIADRFERDGKVKYLGEVGLRFLFPYVDPSDPKEHQSLGDNSNDVAANLRTDMMRHQLAGSQFAVYSFYEEAKIEGKCIDIHQAIKQKDIEVDSKRVTVKNAADENISTTIEFATWLPFAARSYSISSNIDDFILVPVIVIPTDLPNRNGVAFPLKELTKFDPEMGMQAYKTFRGKPCFYEHQNDKIELAYGVIADAFLKPMQKYGQGKIWKLLELLAIDRNKYPTIASAIINREINSYSMGAYVDGYTCSYCDAEFGKCPHLNKNDPVDFYETQDGHLVFRKVYGITGFETSIVVSPAYVSAVNDEIKLLK